jgi:PAS domain S-box-containing protein
MKTKSTLIQNLPIFFVVLVFSLISVLGFIFINKLAGVLIFLVFLFALIVYTIIVRVITAKQQFEKSIEAEERARLIIYTMPLCCIFVDSNAKIIDCNQEAANLFNLSSKQEFIDRFPDLSPEYQPDGKLSRKREKEVIKQTLETGYFRFEWMHQKLDGEQIPTEVTLTRVKYKGEDAIVGYIRDLREQLAMVQEKSKVKIAEESSKAKTKFLAKMSHEIRTPLNSIIGITEIEMLNEDLPPETKEALVKISNSSDLLLHIVNDILDLSKIETDNLALINETYSVVNLINDAVYLNLSWKENKPVEFKLLIDENIPMELIGNETRIKQILNNVLSNAFKYTEKGTVVMDVSFETKDENTVTLVFRIADTGQGMTEEQTHKIFDEFSRFNMEANRSIGGSGLGMNIAYNLVRLMSGAISVKSKKGEGSEFTVRLPQGKTGSAVLGKEQAENIQQFHLSNSSQIKKTQIAREYMPYGRVLVVDDVETNLYVARGLLSPYGLSSDSASSGFEAIDKIKAGNRYDIIFMDHMMPEMDGIETTRIIRSLNYTLPIVALTANAMAGQAELLMENGFDDFISKPIDIRQMNIVLNKLIRDKYPAEVIEHARQQKAKMEALSSGKERQEDTELAEIFSRDASKAIATLETISKNKYRRNEDINMYVTTIHAMKSALANIGETGLSNMAARLEKAGREHDIDQIHDKTPEFLRNLEKIIDKLKPKEEPAIERDSESDQAYLHEELMKIQRACTSYNKKLAKETLAGLREKKWSLDAKQALDAMSEYLLHSEFEALADTAKQYADKIDQKV